MKLRSIALLSVFTSSCSIFACGGEFFSPEQQNQTTGSYYIVHGRHYRTPSRHMQEDAPLTPKSPLVVMVVASATAPTKATTTQQQTNIAVANVLNQTPIKSQS